MIWTKKPRGEYTPTDAEAGLAARAWMHSHLIGESDYRAPEVIYGKAYRVVGDPALTDDAEVYEVRQPDEGSPAFPELYRLDVTLRDAIVLTCDQPGDFETVSEREEMFIELDTLIALGGLARELRDRWAVATAPPE